MADENVPEISGTALRPGAPMSEDILAAIGAGDDSDVEDISIIVEEPSGSNSLTDARRNNSTMLNSSPAIFNARFEQVSAFSTI
jgi:hypothetical protein